MTLHYEQTIEDHIAFSYYYFWSSPQKKESRIVSSLLPLVVIFFIIFSKKGVAFERYGKAELYLLLSGIALFFVMGPLVKWNNARLINNLKASGKNVEMVGSRSLSLEEEKLIITTPYSRSEVLWTALEKMEESRDRFFLFLSVNQACPVPKSVFTSQEQLNSFRSFVTERINGHHMQREAVAG